MSAWRLLGCDTAGDLVSYCAQHLLAALAERQGGKSTVSLALTGGELANAVYDKVAALAGTSPLDPARVHLWWTWDTFVATDNPERNSLQALSRLAGAWALDPAKIHPIPSSSAMADPETAAAQYAGELAEADPIDIALVEFGPAGEIAGLGATSPPDAPGLVVGLANPPGVPSVITMTLAGLNRCREIWVLASGDAVAAAVARAADHDPGALASHLTGTDSVLWLVDQAALAHRTFHTCAL